MFNRHDIDAPLTAHREAEMREANGSKKHPCSLGTSFIHICTWYSTDAPSAVIIISSVHLKLWVHDWYMYAWMSARMIHARMHVYITAFSYACIKILRKILSVITPASFDRNCY